MESFFKRFKIPWVQIFLGNHWNPSICDPTPPPPPRSGKKEFEVTKVTKTNTHLQVIKHQTFSHLLMILSFLTENDAQLTFKAPF